MEEETKIDYNALSRQLAEYGAEAQGKLMRLKVFIQGLRGIGIEIAKNLILAGPKQVFLHDNETVTINDLGSNFYLNQSHVGKVSRAVGSHKQLAELNENVQVIVHDGAIDEKFLLNFDCVVFTEFFDKEKLIQYNDALHQNGKGFIYAGNLGLYGFTFVDYGDKHKVVDATGEQCKNAIIVGITQEEKALVTVHEEKRHGFEDGDTVEFREIEGMTQLNGQRFKISVKSPFTFTIECDTRNYSPYVRNGIAEQVKVDQIVSFRKLKDSLENPVGIGKDSLDIVDFSKIGRAELLHISHKGLLAFVQNHKGLPRLNNEEDANQLVELVKEANKKSKEMEIEGVLKLESISEDDEKIIRSIARYARAQTTMLSAFWGGIICQEIVKLTGKYMPLRQWLHYECFESLCSNAVNHTPLNSRYDDYIAIWGQETMKSLQNKKVFMVGAGALGCEYLKQSALLGLCCGPQGQFIVTDDDQIEISNLNRQFLFRKNNVGHSKSECASISVKNMNPDFNVKPLKLRVSPENDEVFNDDFWESLSFVINAVDNVKARLFVDSRCVWYNIALFESGTLGTKCNSQIIIPKLTQSYGDSVDPPEETIPLCTLKNFPHQIEHCIQWARDYFEGTMVEGPNLFTKFSANPKEFIASLEKEFKQKPGILRTKLETLKNMSQVYADYKFEKAVELARFMFEDIHSNQIKQLLYAFPLDHKTESGQPFWSGPKRPPVAINFNAEDPTHIEFVQAAANIFAYVAGDQYRLKADEIKHLVQQVKVPEFQPKKMKIKVDEKDTTEEVVEDDEQVIKNLINELQNLKLVSKRSMNLMEFEKDDPTNWHIEFLSAVSNLRARNYNIKEISNFQVKIIAGKIIPALATTTAMIVGAVGIEIVKYVLEKPVDQMKNGFMNLALPLWLFSEPMPPIKAKDKDYDEVVMGPVKAVPPGFTNWDRLVVKGPMTIGQFLEYFEKTYQVKVTILGVGKLCVYNGYSQESKKRLTQDLCKIVEELQQSPIPNFKKSLEVVVSAETLEGVDTVIPMVKFDFK